jgi:GWxTD domain-containing protein
MRYISYIKTNMLMKILIKYFLLLMLIPVCGFSQIVDKSLDNLDLNKEYFYVDPLVFNSKDSTNARLDLYIELPLENIQFKRNQSTGKYDAFIDYIITIKNSTDNIVYNNTYMETMSNTENEQKKVTEKTVYAIKQYYLKPDNYKLSFTLIDKNNLKEYTKDYAFSVKDFNRRIVDFSDIMLVSNYNENNDGKKEISPLVNRNVGNLKDFYLFFEIYNSSDSTIENVYYYKITDEKNKTILEGTYNYYLDSGTNKKIEKLSTNLLIIGNYKFEITDKKTSSIVASKDLSYRWDFLPVNLKNLDVAISQLRYLASSDELNYIQRAKTKEEKERRFLKFWRDKDPTPNSPKNELMIEYYNRIKIANERYSHYVDGWKTDMGMVYIIYGNPSNIERHPFEAEYKPYEVWEYYELRRRFVFVDDSGFGDYRLTTPIWDDRTKLNY